MKSFIRHLIVALATLCICGFACKASSKSDFVVVIDAGHGGHDAGALGAQTNEKTINLAVARQLGSMLEKEPGIKVVYTRQADNFVPLQDRADHANKVSGDLFVSIHTNSLDLKAKNRSTVHGAAVYTLGLDKTDDNLAVAMRENSVMKLERDYSTTYQGFDPNSAESYIIFELSQNKHMQQSVDAAKAICKELATTAGRKNNGVKQANFWVLLKTAMPSVLVELDFICNPTEERFMASKEGQKKLAKAICRGIMDYVENVKVPAPKAKGNSSSHTAKPQKESRPSSNTEAVKDAVCYKIQFMTSPKKLRQGSAEFKGLRHVEFYTEKGIHKYTYGAYSSPGQAASDLKRVRTLFPDAFVIKTVGGRRAP